MVSVELQGRTGNQGFQIAATISLALKNSVDYAIPNYSLNEKLWGHYWNFPVKRFRQTKIYYETNYNYHEIPYQPGIVLSGWWQSEKYFKEYKKEVFEALKFRWEPQDYVSIHVRRGDYITTFPTKHPTVTVEYIREAMDFFPTYTRFKFFSDEIAWCKEHFPGHEYSEGESPVEAMQAMINASSCITANSSLSVFAAMMNPNENKTVICPKVFYGPDNLHLESPDRIPEEWIRL